jgi:outer membrane protein assembly factor BamB
MAAFWAGPPADALIMRLTPLKEVLAESPLIFVARVEAVHPEKPAVILSAGPSSKGKLPFKRLAVNLTGDSEAKKHRHTPQLLRRLAPDMPLVVFATQRGKRYTAFAFTNGTWFQMVGRPDPESERIIWVFTHCEPYLRRTFAGTTAELRRIVTDGLAGKKAPPEPNPKEKPGLGPEVQKPKDAEPTGNGVSGSGFPNRVWQPGFNDVWGPGFKRGRVPIHSPCHLVTLSPYHSFTAAPFAVIPTLGLGGPLAVLAMLFPSLFGGVILVFRSWKALITVAGINSTLLILHLWLGRSLEDTWLGPPQSLWLVMLLVTLAGTLWAWRRHLPAEANPDPHPTRSEQVMLWLSSLAFLGAFLFYWFNGLDEADPTWKLLLTLAIGFGTGLAFVLVRVFWPRREAGRPFLPTEGVILWAMIVASTCLAATWQGNLPSVQGTLEKRAASVASQFEGGKSSVQPGWTFVPPNKIGLVVSSCVAYGHRVYAAAALRQGNDQYGVLYRLDARTGEKQWEFDDGGEMKSAFSTPCIAGGRLYIGEGFHTDPDCKLYCLNADTGKKLWDFATTSHTESSPVVVGERVYFGAGDDGVYCLHANKSKNGKGIKIWQFPDKDRATTPTVPGRGESSPARHRLQLHVDATPAVVDGRLYAGSGIGRNSGEPGDPAVFCLEARTGRKLWLLPLERNLPAWGSPVVAGEEVYFGIGNGDMFTDAGDEKPAGALLCVDARTGRERWRYPVGNGVLNRPVVDATRVYFGSRDGVCYAVGRKDGRLHWQLRLGSAVLASPALVRCRTCGTSEYLYVLASDGRVVCVNPVAGDSLWTYRYGPGTFLAATPLVTVDKLPDRQRIRLYFGAGFASRSIPAVCCLVHETVRHDTAAQ